MKKQTKLFITCTIFISAFTYNAFANFTHTVKHTETLWSISDYYDVPIDNIIQLNPSIKDNGLIYSNSELIIPSGDIPVFASSSVNSNENQLLKLINTERQKKNLKPLEADEQLTSLAKIKNKDMNTNNYFNHKSNIYENTSSMLTVFNVPYKYFGENIAKGDYTAKQVFVDWINNDNNENILNEKFTKVGISHLDGNNNYWTIIFTGN